MKYYVDKIFWSPFDNPTIIEADSAQEAVFKFTYKIYKPNWYWTIQKTNGGSKEQYLMWAFPVRIDYTRYRKERLEWVAKIWRKSYYYIKHT